jgi:hypothetical protein
MNSTLIEPTPKHKRTASYYFFEKVPALIFYGMLVFFVFGGVFIPEITAYAIIVLNVYFLYRSASLTITFAISFAKIRHSESIDWLKRLEGFDDKAGTIATLQAEYATIAAKKFTPSDDQLLAKTPKLPRFMSRFIFAQAKRKTLSFIRREIKRLETITPHTNWRDLQHVIIIPHVKEPEHILRETLVGLRNQNFPTKQLNVVLAAEARDPGGLPLSEKLAEEFKDVFNNVWVSNHILTDEEIVGKSSNMKAGGTLAYNKVVELGWDLKKTLVTSCDADSKLPEQYFAYVTSEFVTHDDPEYRFFNAAMVFYNNIWKLPFYARVKNSMSTLFNAARLVRTDKLIPFSTYTTSFWIIKEIGFWTPWVTPEDFHLYLKAQFKFGSKVNTHPVFLRIMSDAAEGKGHVDTIRNNYMQERRWSWGISDDGWVLQNVFLNLGKHDFITVYRALHAVFDHVLSPVMGIMLLVGGNIPPLVNPVFNTTVLGAQLPRISSSIITISLFFLIGIILLDLAYKPKRDNKLGLLNIPIQIAEWIVLPFATFFLSLAPGIEANTRLLFGQYLEYYVTKKH